ncbi:replication initiator [Microbacterium suaedae]|uniref:replication initiator n=1 Tax=Microbacterium suaedae TaxID=2067813 RepID=UPI0038CC0EDD
MKVRCGSRRRSQCPACASIWAGDSAKLGRSGFEDADGHPVAGYRFLFLTLTAPSFGRTHLVAKWERDEGKRCGCGATHGRDETALRGLPLDLNGYDYTGQVRWHQSLGKLWNVTVGRMRRLVPDMEFYRVLEAQARGALYVHAIVRIPEWSKMTAAELLAEAQAATTVREGVIVPTTGEVITETYAWVEGRCARGEGAAPGRGRGSAGRIRVAAARARLHVEDAREVPIEGSFVRRAHGGHHAGADAIHATPDGCGTVGTVPSVPGCWRC